MSRFLRGYLGALIGALIVLFAYPTSRPVMALILSEQGEGPVLGRTKWIPGNQPVLPQPDDNVTAGLWMVVGSDRLQSARADKKADLGKLLVVANRASKTDPDNAFWFQMSAAILNALGRRSEAETRWLRASQAAKWSDYQTERLERIVGELQAHSGARASWQVLAVHPIRSIKPAEAIERYAHAVISAHGLKEGADLRLRHATVMNGMLMRNGSRSLGILTIGADIIEMASYPPKLEASPKRKSLLLARYALINALRKSGRKDEANEANEAFRTNDGWLYLTGSVDPGSQFRLLSIASLLTTSVPSALLGVALIASLLWIAGQALLRRPGLQAVFKLPFVPILGLCGGILIYAALHLAVVAVAATAAFGFVAFAPGRQRTRPSEDLGPFFRFTLVMIAAALTGLIVALLTGVCTPGLQLLPSLGVTPDYTGGSGALVGLAGIALGLLLLVAPCWALVRKVSTSWVLSLGLRDLGKGLCLGAATVSILAAIASLYLDKKLYDKATMIMQNEPVYYSNE